MMSSNSCSLEKKVLITAADLFYRKGIHNVGINEIVATSGVAKMTLYKYFPSKDQLIVEVIRYWVEEWQHRFRDSVNRDNESLGQQLLAIFDFIEEWFNSPNFQKCPFSTTAAQLTSENHLALELCMEPMNIAYSFLLKSSKKAGIHNPDDFTQQILLLIGGCIMSANLQGAAAGIEALHCARKVAATLKQQAEIT